MTKKSTFVLSGSLVQAAYQHCLGIASTLLARDGQLAPALFLVGQPTQGQDFQSCRMAGAGVQAMQNFHASTEALQKLTTFIRASLTPSTKEYAALQPQIGPVLLALHSFLTALSLQEAVVPNPGTTPVLDANGVQQYLVLAVHTLHGIDMALCPLLHDAAGQLLVQAQPLELLHCLPPTASVSSAT
ncbi:MAG: hypothetical protein PHX60_04345 [Giesbergeria sp.]|uniref:hypothetical protein n=1 Tax=Giesbergeria sp. TaxID=2818473 RepID=UPI00260232CC|nr:hypothetical protein [Giesbergeria sp.]MDD2608911.1 hypothetical protein [Giesbergeria sp.]